jgi:small conductance mechanosensitive channel
MMDTGTVKEYSMFQLFEPTRRNRAHWLARWAAISIAGLTWALPFQAGTQEPAEDLAATQSLPSNPALPNEVLESINPALKRMRLLDANIKRLEARLKSADGMALKVLETRLQRNWNDLIETVHETAQQVLVHAEEGYDTSAYNEQLTALLVAAPTAIYAVIDRLNQSVIIPGSEASAAEQAAVDAEGQVAIDHVIVLYGYLLKNIELARQFGVDADADETALNARLEERAANISAFLDLAIESADAMRTQLASIPTDAEIAARLGVSEQRVAFSSEVLKTVTSLMATQKLDTSLYEAQLIATTGEITTDIFDIKVLAGLLSGSLDSLGAWAVDNGGSMFFSMLVFVVIVVIFYKLAQIAQRLLRRAMESAHVQVSQLLHRMILSTTRTVIIAVGLLIALSQLGISLGPLLAGLGIAGFVIGFALQDSLSNFASGMMILIYKPFDVGDLVEVGGVFGTVRHMSLVNTTVLTIDNQTLVVPNNSIWQNVIKNVTAQDTRRIDMTFGIGYSDDIPKAERILEEIIETHDSVLEDPEPMVRLHELGDSSVNFVVRPWVKTDDYWPVYWDITRAVKLAFDAQGITIPFPQRDVHLFNELPQAATTREGENQRGGADKDAVEKHRREFGSTTASVGEDD